MSKRRGDDAGIDTQMRREEYEAQDDGGGGASGGGSSGFTRASKEEMKKRTIRKINRSSFAKRASERKAANNPFGGLNLASGSSTPATGASTSMFGTPASGATQTTSLFGSSTPAKDNTPTTTSSGLFGDSNASSSVTPSKSLFPASVGTSNGASGTEGSTGGGLFGLNGTSVTSTNASPANNKSEHLKTVAALNTKFCSWVHDQLKVNEAASLEQGVLKYLHFAGKLTKASPAESSAQEPSTVKESSSAIESSPSGNLFGGLTSTSGSGSGSGTGTGTGNLFGGPTSTTTSTSTTGSGNLFGGASSGTTSLFGSSSGSSNLFGGSGEASTTQSSGLFGGASSAAPAPKDTEEEDEVSPPVEKTIVEDALQPDEELKHKVRAKVLYLAEKEWRSKGTGDLSLIKIKDSNRAFLVLRSDSGRVTFNVSLVPGMNVKVDTKSKSVDFVAVSYKEGEEGKAVPENEGTPVPFKIRVKNVERAEALAQEIKSLLP
mmetsp:Transcript_382/g.524  ORF Transcript_382/g.524 Transcript_382/m.524 type:complete len:491 (+) Transcript_382:157-1629(+)